MDVSDWLRELGLERYEQAFRENEIDWEVLPELTESDLEKLGLPLGPRKKLQKAITALGRNEIPAAAPPREAERRQLTVMFVDLVGSTALSARLDPEDMGEVIRRYQNAVAGEVTRFEGHVAKFMGDGVLAYFGWPRAHEDEAERAVRAGLALVEAVSGLASPAGAPLSARVGIATGLVVVGDLVGDGAAHEQGVVGDTPNLAARLQGVAQPGQVVIGETTRRLLGADFEMADLGPQELKGLDEPVGAFAATGQRAMLSRFEARAGRSLMPMVGRDQELALLLERWAQAKAGEGQGLLLVGEAGIGKSRIVRALLDAVTDEPHTRIQYQCSPHHTDSALWPVIQQLGHAVGFGAQVSDDERLDLLEALLAQAGEVADAVPLLAHLIGVDTTARYDALDLTAQARRARTLDALIGQMLGLATRQPVLLVLEDCHWIDPTTLELIEQSLDRITDARVLLLLTSRPDNQPVLAALPHVTRLTLNRLNHAGVEAIVKRLGGESLTPDVISAIIARTDGVPLFVEELTKAILETGETTIPASLHDTLMARLDRIPEVKKVAQIAACIGREFDFSLLAAVAGRADDDLGAALDQLTRSELIFRRGSPPNASYTFKHALLQDAAYQSLLKSRRRQLHARIAEAIETWFPETVADQPEVVARHCTEAGFAARAIDLWQRAGEREAARSAHLEAIAHFQKGLSLIDALPEDADRSRRELELRIALGPVLMAAEGMASDRAAETYGRAHELSREVGDQRQAYAVTWGLWVSHHNRGLLDEAQRLARELLVIAEQTGQSDLLLQGHHAAWTTLFFQDDLPACVEHTERGRALYDIDLHRGHAFRFGGHDPGMCASATGGLALWLVGFPDRAVARVSEAVALAERLDHPASSSIAMFFTSILYHYRREPARLRAQLEALRAICREKNIPHFDTSRAILNGWAEAAEGNGEQGVAGIRRALDLQRQSPVGLRRPYYLGVLAEALAQSGDVQAALAAVEEGLARRQRADDRNWEPELHRLRGELLRRERTQDDSEIEHCFRHAFEAARRQGAKSLELRAATSLARHLAERNKRRRAHELLASVYGWFTEGLDTQDLIDAKRLLDDLA